MRASFLRTIALALCLCLSLACAARADAYGYKIDVSAMKALEAADAFPVKVTLKKVVEEYFDTELMDNNGDLLAFTVENGTDGEVSGFTLYFVAYDDGELTQDITSGIVSSIASGGKPQLSTVTPPDVSIAPGGTYETGLAVNYSRFTGVRAMIADYTLPDGTVVENPAFAAWQTLAYGMVSDSSTELD